MKFDINTERTRPKIQHSEKGHILEASSKFGKDHRVKLDGSKVGYESLKFPSHQDSILRQNLSLQIMFHKLLLRRFEGLRGRASP